MQYILGSGFVSLVASVNIGIFIFLSVLGCPYLSKLLTISSMLQATVGTCGIILNIYVLLYSRRKLDTLAKSLKPIKAYFLLLKNALAELRCLVIDLSNIQLLKNVSRGFICQHFGFDDILKYFSRPCAIYFGARSKKVTSSNFQTPELNSMSQKFKMSKAQSDPVKKPEKLSIKEKYLPAKSPELFKNKIYLTRRNLTNALGDK